MQHPSYSAMQKWLKGYLKEPHLWDKLSSRVQGFTQKLMPAQLQMAITGAMEGFTKVVMTGSGFILPKMEEELTLPIREKMSEEAVLRYVKLGMVSGAGTSAGGIFTGLLDLPLLMTMKMRLIFEIGALFGHDLKEPKERLFALLVFRTAFSNPMLREEKIKALIHFESKSASLEAPLEAIDWEAFQQEYRDYIDLAKLMQFIPGIGIVIGASVNRQLINHLGETAINAYRLRYFQNHPEERNII